MLQRHATHPSEDLALYDDVRKCIVGRDCGDLARAFAPGRRFGQISSFSFSFSFSLSGIGLGGQGRPPLGCRGPRDIGAEQVVLHAVR